ncbi:DUF596 domain-containing protein [Acinetobacter sp. CFCC 10889]|uniref:DUF596 domain-containing protein n=1 Tax=Acinetobacter sp. CFCC 10889 TaxID=1775557 RepID=UPI000DD09E09|nr:DUF596 domain-containing protein [Acinetobacter sp. CFCC 10889]
MSYESSIKKIASNEYDNIQALNGLWSNIDSIYLFLSQYGDLTDFNFKKKVFFNVLEYSMNKHWLKLAKEGKFLSGSIDEQVSLFRDAFPKSEIDNMEQDPIFFEAWFFSDACPAGAVWVYNLDNAETHYEWT